MNAPSTHTEPGVSVVIPCYREENAIEATIAQVQAAMQQVPHAWEIIAVNDASPDRTGEMLDELAKTTSNLRVLHNQRNQGYGGSLKRGISASKYDRIVITDADGTYPNDRIPELVAGLDRADMVVGARIGANVNIPMIRRPAKWMLTRYARWLAGADIKDLNSGLRAVWARHVYSVWNMLPNGFSFTTTITIASHVNRLAVDYLPIDYYKRVGSSTIRPIRDTLRFFFLVVRTIMMFRPLPVFGTLAVILMIMGVLVGTLGKLVLGEVPDVASGVLFMSGMNFLGLGLLGDLINARRGNA